jgi:hypothetical protein
MAEQRAAPRHRVLKGGIIVLSNGASIECVVRNLSTTGAALELQTPASIPNEFTLIIRGEQQQPCHVSWRKGKRLGVIFVNSGGLPPNA